jgi:hypothetical protein
MSTIEMDPEFSEGLRAALKKTVNDAARVRRNWRWHVGTGVFVGVALVGGGVALASGIFSPPGGPVDTQLGSVVSVTRTGTATIDLGPAPKTANAILLELTCLSPGTFTFPSGSSLSCGAADTDTPSNLRMTSETVPLGSGVDSVTITAAANASWSLNAIYENRIATPWGINAEGETYGVPNQQGTPDLIAVVTDQGGIHGYVKASQLDCASGAGVRSPAQALKWGNESQNRSIAIPVYDNDGTTEIGTFVIGDAAGSHAQTVPLSSLSLDC